MDYGAGSIFGESRDRLNPLEVEGEMHHDKLVFPARPKIDNIVEDLIVFE